MFNSRHILFAMSCLAALTSGAEDLKTEIVVDRSIVPAERAATRLNSVMPDILSMQIRPVELAFTEYTSASELTASITRLDPATYPGLPGLTPYRGYAAVGYFPIFELGASAGYRFINTERTRLGAWIQYDGTSYDGYADIDGEKPKVKDNTVTVGADFGQLFGKASLLNVGADYTYAALANPLYGNDYTQSINIFDARASWQSQTNRVAYKAGAEFRLFDFGKDMPLAAYGSDAAAPGANENRFTVTAGATYNDNTGQPIVGLDIKADFLHSGNGLTAGWSDAKAAKPEWPTLGVISLTPYYSIKYDALAAKIGLNVDLSTGGNDKRFHIAPDVIVSLAPASQFAVYARVGGGEHLNSLRSLYEYTPFIPSAWVYGRSHLPITVDAGFNIGPFKGAAIELFGGYAVANDWLMPMLAFGKETTPMFSPVSMKGFHFGARLSYTYGRYVTVRASIEGAPQKYDRGYYRWRDRAKMVVGAGATVHPIESIDIDIDYSYRAKRRIYSATPDEYASGNAVAESLGDANDLSIGAAYRITEPFTVFARGENILNRRYDIFPGLPSNGVHGLVGVTYKF